MIAVGLVGLGEIGQHHLAAIRDSEHANLAAVCDADLALARRDAPAGAAAFAGAEEMLAAGGLDAVSVCLPHHLHLPVGLAVLRAGCDLLVEKPMAISTDACDELIAAAAEAGRRIAVSHNQLFYEPHRRLIELLDSGELGAPRTLRARLGVGGKYGAWRADPVAAGGGLLIDAGAHRVYLLRRLGGPVSAVSAVMDAPGEEDRLSVTLRFASGALGTIDAAYHGPEGVFDDRVEVFAARGLAEVAGCEAYFEGFATDGPRLRVWRDGGWHGHRAEGSWQQSVRDSVHAALRALDGDGAPPVDGGAGRDCVALIEAAYESARSGRVVELGRDQACA